MSTTRLGSSGNEICLLSAPRVDKHPESQYSLRNKALPQSQFLTLGINAEVMEPEHVPELSTKRDDKLSSARAPGPCDSPMSPERPSFLCHAWPRLLFLALTGTKTLGFADLSLGPAPGLPGGFRRHLRQDEEDALAYRGP